jgi:hypothetical protein
VVVGGVMVGAGDAAADVAEDNGDDAVCLSNCRAINSW